MRPAFFRPPGTRSVCDRLGCQMRGNPVRRPRRERRLHRRQRRRYAAIDDVGGCTSYCQLDLQWSLLTRLCLDGEPDPRPELRATSMSATLGQHSKSRWLTTPRRTFVNRAGLCHTLCAHAARLQISLLPIDRDCIRQAILIACAITV